MKIGIVCYPTFGGSGVVATELGKALADEGHCVHFIASNQPARLDSFHDNVYYHEVRFADYPLFEIPPYESALASKIVDVTKYESLDILHVHYAIPHAATAFMAKQILLDEQINLPVITTLHGTDITLVGRDITYKPVVTFALNHSDGVTAVSESLRKDTYEHFDIRNGIEVIPNFVDFRRFSKTNKDHFRKAIAPNDEKILIHTSNFRKVKRVEDVVKMFKLVQEKIPANLLLVGDGPERQHIEQYCRNEDLCDRIRFLGKQDAVEELLAVSDLFVLTSEQESFGLAALEAMACHVPVISSNAGGIPEINIHGKTGFVEAIGDYKKMAADALNLLEDPQLLQQFRDQAFAQAQRFSLQKIMPMYTNYYQKIIKKTSGVETA